MTTLTSNIPVAKCSKISMACKSQQVQQGGGGAKMCRGWTCLADGPASSCCAFLSSKLARPQLPDL